jgi:N-acetylglutamate synthase-like GNAT family acetyltransferase
MYHYERGKEKNADFTYIFEDDSHNIIGIIVPDGDSFNTCIKNGYEYIFSKMLDLGEKELKPLFDKNEDGSINFLVVSHDSLSYQSEELKRRGYEKEEAGDYDNVIYPQETNYVIELPKGFKQVFGYNYSDGRKGVACHYGFHSEFDDGDLDKEGQEGSLSYQARKQSQFYKDSFESLIVTDDGDICSYSFIYVDKETKTAFIEPVSTREKYRKKGFATQMLRGAINKLKEMGIESVYINSYDWRVKVYNSVGFKTIDSIGMWVKKIK